MGQISYWKHKVNLGGGRERERRKEKKKLSKVTIFVSRWTRGLLQKTVTQLTISFVQFAGPEGSLLLKFSPLQCQHQTYPPGYVYYQVPDNVKFNTSSPRTKQSIIGPFSNPHAFRPHPSHRIRITNTSSIFFEWSPSYRIISWTLYTSSSLCNFTILLHPLLQAQIFCSEFYFETTSENVLPHVLKDISSI
jgi:hypothetical protein